MVLSRRQSSGHRSAGPRDLSPLVGGFRVRYNKGGTPAAVQGLLYILLLFGCVLLHEFGHAIAAKTYGIKTPDITLLPIRGVARLERMPEKPIQEFIVAIAGPLVNVAIAFALYIVMAARGDLWSLDNLQNPNVGLLSKLYVTNVMLVLFNLLPAFPMDGGRILRALLATRMNYARATQWAATVGQGMAFLFAFAGLFWNPMLLLIAFFVYIGASQEAAFTQMKAVTSGLTVSEAMVKDFQSLPASATLADAVEMLLRTSQHDFPVVGTGGDVEGILTRQDLMAALQRDGNESPVTSAMRTGIPSVSAHARFEEAFQAMHGCGCPALPVLNREGRLVGLFTPENVGELMMVHAALRRGESPPWRKQPARS